jgi:hypothetical protein
MPSPLIDVLDRSVPGVFGLRVLWRRIDHGALTRSGGFARFA